jgi:hypothetical protein
VLYTAHRNQDCQPAFGVALPQLDPRAVHTKVVVVDVEAVRLAWSAVYPQDPAVDVVPTATAER